MIGRLIRKITFRMRHVTMAVALMVLASAASAQTGLFDRGWTLRPEASSLSFQTVKNNSKVETSSFATFTGQIDPQGDALVKIQLESVDTKIDLRNVRMRFLLFETFKFPEATITAHLNAADLADLPTLRRKTVHVPLTVDLHGVSKTVEADMTISVLDLDTVSVASASPITVAAADFDLADGIAKLEEAANVSIVPSTSLSFDFLFARNTASGAPTPAAAAPASTALEPTGNLDVEACKGRFEILSRAQSIYFTPGSAALDDKSLPFLASLADIVTRCPGMTIEVAGHTDSDGSESANQRLSERRAASVAAYLVKGGIDAHRILSVGYGETLPLAPNDTAKGKARNRRIEFVVVE